MKVVQSCTIQNDIFVNAPAGQLFGEVALNDELNEDTDAGQCRDQSYVSGILSLEVSS